MYRNGAHVSFTYADSCSIRCSNASMRVNIARVHCHKMTDMRSYDIVNIVSVVPGVISRKMVSQTLVLAKLGCGFNAVLTSWAM